MQNIFETNDYTILLCVKNVMTREGRRETGYACSTILRQFLSLFSSNWCVIYESIRHMRLTFLFQRKVSIWSTVNGQFVVHVFCGDLQRYCSESESFQTWIQKLIIISRESCRVFCDLLWWYVSYPCCAEVSASMSLAWFGKAATHLLKWRNTQDELARVINPLPLGRRPLSKILTHWNTGATGTCSLHPSCFLEVPYSRVCDQQTCMATHACPNVPLEGTGFVTLSKHKLTYGKMGVENDLPFLPSKLPGGKTYHSNLVWLAKKKPIHPSSQKVGYDWAEKHSIDLHKFNVHPQ